MPLLESSKDERLAPEWQKFLGHYAVAVFGSMFWALFLKPYSAVHTRTLA
jgi:hypothetical protein